MAPTKPAGVHEISAISDLAAQMAIMTQRMDCLSATPAQGNLRVQNRYSSQGSSSICCDLCNGPHASAECEAGNPFFKGEQANQIGFGNYNQPRNDPYSNFYNPGFKNHPNLSWRDNQNVQNRPQNFQQQEKKPDLEGIIAQLAGNINTLSNNTNQFIVKTEQFMGKTETTLQNQGASIHNLEVQVGQLANAISGRERGSLPSQTELNPKGKEQAFAITLRSGVQVKTTVDLEGDRAEKLKLSAEKAAGESVIDCGTLPVDRTNLNQKNQSGQPRFAVEHNWPDSSQPAPEVKAYDPPIPFPQRLKKNNVDAKFSKFLDIFKKLQVNIPFAEALEQIPSYAKFMKDILSKKRKLEEHEKIQLTEECSAIVQRKLPIKQKDPGSFTIPCTIGTTFIERSLCDLGSSINLMPLSVAKRIGLKEIAPTTVSLQMADRSITYPWGLVEDVLVKVGNAVFPADFLILDMEEDPKTPIILGRPFLSTGRALIDVEQGQLTLRGADEHMTFKVFEAQKSSMVSQSCFRMDAIDMDIPEKFLKEPPCNPEIFVQDIQTEQENHEAILQAELVVKTPEIGISKKKLKKKKKRPKKKKKKNVMSEEGEVKACAHYVVSVAPNFLPKRPSRGFYTTTLKDPG